MTRTGPIPPWLSPFRGSPTDLMDRRRWESSARSPDRLYESGMSQQLIDAQAKRGPGDLATLISSAGTWEVN